MDPGTAVRRLRRIAAYGLCRDDAGRVLLVRASTRSAHAGRWLLPGGGVDHGEHPAEAVVREIAEETGLRALVGRIRDVVTDVERLPDALRHQDRLIFDCRVVGGDLRAEVSGSSDRAAWWPADRLATLPLMPHTARQLAVPGPLAPAGEVVIPEPRAAQPGQAPVPDRFQRFAAYGLVSDPAGRVLLALIAETYPGAGRWHLPGGGTDFGEPASAGFLREVAEETGQRARITGLLAVSHRHHRAAVGPEGVPIDWHGVRVVYQATVDYPTPARVVEAQGGSTAEARWFSRPDLPTLALTEVAREAIETIGPLQPVVPGRVDARANPGLTQG